MSLPLRIGEPAHGAGRSAGCDSVLLLGFGDSLNLAPNLLEALLLRGARGESTIGARHNRGPNPSLGVGTGEGHSRPLLKLKLLEFAQAKVVGVLVDLPKAGEVLLPLPLEVSVVQLLRLSLRSTGVACRVFALTITVARHKSRIRPTRIIISQSWAKRGDTLNGSGKLLPPVGRLDRYSVQCPVHLRKGRVRASIQSCDGILYGLGAGRSVTRQGLKLCNGLCTILSKHLPSFSTGE